MTLKDHLRSDRVVGRYFQVCFPSGRVLRGIIGKVSLGEASAEVFFDSCEESHLAKKGVWEFSEVGSYIVRGLDAAVVCQVPERGLTVFRSGEEILSVYSKEREESNLLGIAGR